MTHLTQLSLREEYKLLFRDVLQDILAEQLGPLHATLRDLKGQGASEYLSTDEALKLLHISKPTLHKLRAQGRIECFHSSDSRVLYKRSQIEAYIRSQQKK